MPQAPLIGITSDVHEGRTRVSRTYARAVSLAGGVPVVLAPPGSEDADRLALAHLDAIDALVLTGGDDPRTEPFGVPTDPRVTPVEASRQAYETALCRLALERDVPTLGVCLGMQMLALCAGGSLDQWMPDSTPTHADHWGDKAHTVRPTGDATGGRIEGGVVTSHHRQAVSDAGSMRVIATAHDGVVEAIDLPGHRFLLGVQWHPERTEAEGLGLGLYVALVNACV